MDKTEFSKGIQKLEFAYNQTFSTEKLLLWYEKLKEKCERAPDKLHILFFDELTNALPSIQGMAFNIILDKEVNGKWKLPKNCRIVAAGNDMDDSLAANEMVRPLFSRFAHVYIKTSLNGWLKWASTPNSEYERLDYKERERKYKIHPAIYAYIAHKGNNALRTKYTGEKPHADPRRWEMASKVLSETNNPYMLKGIIGEELTKEFAAFCKHKVITIDDVIEGNYTEADLKMNVGEKYMTAVGLSLVDEDNVQVVRKFVNKLGPETLATFDTLWTLGDPKRLEKLAELNINKNTVKR